MYSKLQSYEKILCVPSCLWKKRLKMSFDGKHDLSLNLLKNKKNIKNLSVTLFLHNFAPHLRGNAS